MIGGLVKLIVLALGVLLSARHGHVSILISLLCILLLVLQRLKPRPLNRLRVVSYSVLAANAFGGTGWAILAMFISLILVIVQLRGSRGLGYNAAGRAGGVRPHRIKEPRQMSVIRKHLLEGWIRDIKGVGGLVRVSVASTKRLGDGLVEVRLAGGLRIVVREDEAKKLLGT